MKITLGELLYKIKVTKDKNFDIGMKKAEKSFLKVSKSTGKMKKGLSKLTGSFKGFVSKLMNVKTLIGGFLVGAVARLTGEFINLGGEAQKIEQTFDILNQTLGESADVSLKKMREATRGLVSDLDLMKAGNKLVSMHLANNSDEMAKLAKMAVTLGGAMGKDAVGAMEDFALMLANQSIPRLDTFGISSGRVRARIEELQKANKGMTREQAFLNAVMEIGSKKMELLGDKTLTTSERIQQMKVKLQNLKTNIAKAALPAVESLVEQFTGVIGGAEMSSEQVNKLAFTMYKGANYFVAFLKTLGLLGKGLKTFVGVLGRVLAGIIQGMEDVGNTVLKTQEAVLLFISGKFKKGKEAFSSIDFKKTKFVFNDLKNFFNKQGNDISKQIENIYDSFDKAHGKGFKKLVDKKVDVSSIIAKQKMRNMIQKQVAPEPEPVRKKKVERVSAKEAKDFIEVKDDLLKAYEEVDAKKRKIEEDFTAFIKEQNNQRLQSYRTYLNYSVGMIKGLRHQYEQLYKLQEDHLAKVTNVTTNVSIDGGVKGGFTAEELSNILGFEIKKKL